MRLRLTAAAMLLIALFHVY
ncbi:hypothetical protein [Sicyoidochytrium minutum DNA virus]|nr:hypothetical protein [Sicyoidochytrium minutum DNA virus]